MVPRAGFPPGLLDSGIADFPPLAIADFFDRLPASLAEPRAIFLRAAINECPCLAAGSFPRAIAIVVPSASCRFVSIVWHRASFLAETGCREAPLRLAI